MPKSRRRIIRKKPKNKQNRKKVDTHKLNLREYYTGQKKEIRGFIQVGLVVSLFFFMIAFALFQFGWRKTSYGFLAIFAMFAINLIEDYFKIRKCNAEIRRCSSHNSS